MYEIVDSCIFKSRGSLCFYYTNNANKIITSGNHALILVSYLQKYMPKQKPRIDIVNELLEECILSYPVSSFIISLYKQYLQKGSLSKKQLQGLYGKTEKLKHVAPGKLATLEALIKKMPTRYKSELPMAKPLFEKDVKTGQMIDEILAKYSQHKQVLFLKAKYDNNELFSAADIADLKRFSQLSRSEKDVKKE